MAELVEMQSLGLVARRERTSRGDRIARLLRVGLLEDGDPEELIMLALAGTEMLDLDRLAESFRETVEQTLDERNKTRSLGRVRD